VVELRQTFGFSFRELELGVFQKLQAMFVGVMQDVLKELDEAVLRLRNKKRYEVKEVRSGCVPTLMGDVEYKRRYYLDKKTGEYVFLLDEVLDVEAGRVSPGLAMAAAMQAVLGPSYRAARESLARLYGHQVVSHETIRQLILRLGELVEKEEEKKREEAKGTRKVPVLFVETDGYWCSMQRDKKKSREMRMMVAHEGWEGRTPSSKEYELVHKTHYLDLDSKDFWEKASRHLYSRYDIDENMMVVINGDRASWIRKGVEYFPKAIYQADRFHIKRDLRRLLQGTKELRVCLEAFQRSDTETLVRSLTRAREKAKAATGDLTRFAQINDLLQDIRKMPDAYKDYRVRLKEMGYDISGMRGMGAAESNVDKFSNRLKKRGQSWSVQGLKAMVHSLVKYFEGKLEHYSKHISRIHSILDDAEISRKASGIAHRVLDEIGLGKKTNMPITQAGRTRSGGLSRLLNNLSCGNALIT
jgi:hypothetical protein